MAKKSSDFPKGDPDLMSVTGTQIWRECPHPSGFCYNITSYRESPSLGQSRYVLCVFLSFFVSPH